MMLSIQRKIGIVLSVMIFIAILNIMVVFYFQKDRYHISTVMKIAGQQAMLIERIANMTLAVSNGYDSGRNILIKTLVSYENNLNNLQYGNKKEAGKESLPAAPNKLRKTLMDNRLLWNELKTQVQIVSNEPYFNEEFTEAYIVVDNLNELISEKFNELITQLRVINKQQQFNPELIKLNELKFRSQQTAKLASSIFIGHKDHENLKSVIEKFQADMKFLYGRLLEGKPIRQYKAFKNIKKNFSDVALLWGEFGVSAIKLYTKPRDNQTFQSAINYILQYHKDLNKINKKLIDEYDAYFKLRNRNSHYIMISLLSLNLLIFLIGYKLVKN